MRQLRDTTPGKVHLLTCRTRQSELLLVPNEKLNNCIGGIIAKYALVYNITLYSVVVLSNHYHLLLSGENISRFAENINREIAKRTNYFLKRSGSLWGRRYDDQITIEEADELEGLLYILTNPVKHGLVSHSKHWPGIITYNQALGAKPQEYTFINHTEFYKAKLKARTTGQIIHRSDYETKYQLRISPIKLYENLNDQERIKVLNELIEKRIINLINERKKEGKGFLGRKAVLEQAHIGVFPLETNKTPRPSCYTRSLNAVMEFKKTLKLKLAQYKEASIKYRSGKEGVIFPPNCFYPPRHHLPKNYSLIHT